MRRSSIALHRLTTIALCAAFITICAWIHIPFFLPFTLQLLAIFLISSLFPLKISLTSVLVYITAGLLGVPVFSGFRAGISAFAEPSGGFLIGFVLSTLIISLVCRNPKRSLARLICTELIALSVCYGAGVLWYMLLFGRASDISIIEALAVCVLPFLVPDLMKIILACTLDRKLHPYLLRLGAARYKKGDNYEE